MKRNIIPVILMLAALVCTSCEFLEECLSGDGNIETEERLGATFTEVQCEGEFPVRIENSETISVLVTTDANLQRKLETTVNNGKLTIRTNHDGCIDYSSATEVVVKCPTLTSVSQLGSGTVEVFNFNSAFFEITQAGSGVVRVSNLSVANTLEANLIGSGDIWLNGRSQSAIFELSGSGSIDAESFRVFECEAMLSGSGNIHTFVYDQLNATISGSGSGNIYYYGNPEQVVKNEYGSGQIINRSSTMTN